MILPGRGMWKKKLEKAIERMNWEADFEGIEKIESFFKSFPTRWQDWKKEEDYTN